MKCKTYVDGCIKVRRDYYCTSCFNNYIRSKYRKASDAWRLEFPNGEKNVKILLALSGGLSSSTMLEMAYSSVKNTRGRYQMPVVLHIDESQYLGAAACEDQVGRIAWLQTHCPDMQYVHRKLQDVDCLADSEMRVNTDLNGVSNRIVKSAEPNPSLRDAIASLSSKTSQGDMLSLYRDRLIQKTAMELGCQAIYFGDSATTAAAKTLALTAKGRGYTLPWTVADYCISEESLWSVRPMKQILTSEIFDYAKLIGIPANVPNVRLGRATSIDELTQRYFNGLQEQFPSLVSTVVRTTNKLVEPVKAEDALGSCCICGTSFTTNARQWLSDITVSEPAPNDYTLSSGQLQPHYDDSVDTTQLLCYGCEVALRGSKGSASWPVLNVTQSSSRKHTVGMVLQEYEITNE